MTFSLFHGIIAAFALGIANCATFFIDDGFHQSQPFPLDRYRMNRFRRQILSLMGINRPTEDVNAADELASHYMSLLYKAIGSSNAEQQFNANFKSFTTRRDQAPIFNYDKIQFNVRASDAIISFVPKSIVQSNNSHLLTFEFNTEEFAALHLLGAELHCVFNETSTEAPQFREITVSNAPNDSDINVKFKLHENETFFSLNISNLLDFRLDSAQLWLRFLDTNGQTSVYDFPKMDCFGVGFFVEGEQNILQRVRRSFAFEVEENWDEEYPENVYNTAKSPNKKNEGKNKQVPTMAASEIGPTQPNELDQEMMDEETIFDDDTSWGLVSESETNNGPSGILSNNNTPTNRNVINDNSTTNSSVSNNFLGSPSTSRFHSVLRAFSRSRRCQVRSLYVDFKDLGWDGWVIAPAGYQADYCDGDCSFPLDSSVSPTNHAIVQTLMHLFDKKQAVPAKCAPIAMRAQSLLFFNSQKNIVMRRYQNMRVKQCGCR